MKRAYNYHQLEIIRVRAVCLGLHAEWIQDGTNESAWLRVGQGINEIVLCWFPGAKPIFSVQSQGHDADDLVEIAKELVALTKTLTSGPEFAARAEFSASLARMKRVYSPGQLEMIRQRAAGLGLETRQSRSEDFGACMSVVPACDEAGSIAYFESHERLTTLQIWGDLEATAKELDALHALLTAGPEFSALASSGES